MQEVPIPAMACLASPLPEDIANRKASGDWDGAIALIDERLRTQNSSLPRMLRDKLQVEREILKRLPLDYPDSRRSLFEKLKAELPDLTKEEFILLRNEGRLDFILVNGEERYIDSAVQTLLNDPKYAKRSATLLGKKWEEFPEGYLAVRSCLSSLRERKELSFRFRVHAGIQEKSGISRADRVAAYLPLPRTCCRERDGLIQSEIRILKTTENCRVYVAPEEAGQRIVYLEKEWQENQEFFVEYEYNVRVFYQDLWKDYGEEAFDSGSALETNDGGERGQSSVCKAGGSSEWVKREDREEQLPHVQFTPFLKALCREIVSGQRGDLQKARAIYDYITKNIRYSYMRTYFTIENLSEYAAVNRKGDCGVQSLLFITLCRIAGIPAKWQSGNAMKPPSHFGSHDWALVFLPVCGWVPVDCSFGGGAFAHGDEERRRFYFGNLDPWRMVANASLEGAFVPPVCGLRRDPYDNQSGEIQIEGEEAANQNPQSVQIPRSVTKRMRTDQEVAVNKYLMEYEEAEI